MKQIDVWQIGNTHRWLAVDRRNNTPSVGHTRSEAIGKAMWKRIGKGAKSQCLSHE